MNGLGNMAALRRWLDSAVEGGVNAELRASLIAGGRSNPTYVISEPDGGRTWILRRPPHGHVLPTAHNMGREHRVITALADTGVPVPATVGLCKDPSILGAEFYVMEKLDGITLRTYDDTSALTVDQRARLRDNLISIMVTLHEVDPAAVGLADWGRPDGYLARQLDRWGKQWAASVTTPRREADQLVTWLREHLPTSTMPGIVHGDFKIDNLMVDRDDPTRILGVLDWEMSTLGNTLTDLGILCSFWDQEGEFFNPITAGATAMPGFGTREEVVAAYAEARGIQVDDLTWYMVFADYKIAVILEGIHARHLQGHTTGADFEDVGDMVLPLFERALDRASSFTSAGSTT